MERPDWNASADAAPITQASADALAKEIATSDGPAHPPAIAPQKTGISRPDWNYDHHGNAGREVVASSDDQIDKKTNLPIDFIRTAERSMDGYKVSLNLVRDVATARLDELAADFGIDQAQFIERFDKLSPNIRSKYFTAMLRGPHLGLIELINLVEKQMTLSEANEAESFLRGLR